MTQDSMEACEEREELKGNDWWKRESVLFLQAVVDHLCQALLNSEN